jgi:hypothetical protein
VGAVLQQQQQPPLDAADGCVGSPRPVGRKQVGRMCIVFPLRCFLWKRAAADDDNNSIQFFIVNSYKAN